MKAAKGIACTLRIRNILRLWLAHCVYLISVDVYTPLGQFCSSSGFNCTRPGQPRHKSISFNSEQPQNDATLHDAAVNDGARPKIGPKCHSLGRVGGKSRGGGSEGLLWELQQLISSRLQVSFLRAARRQARSLRRERMRERERERVCAH